MERQEASGKGKLKVPAEMGQKGIPPGVGKDFRKSQKSGDIKSPVEFGDQGKPVHKRAASQIKPYMNE